MNFNFEPLKSGKPHGSWNVVSPFYRTNYLVCSTKKKEVRFHWEKTYGICHHIQILKKLFLLTYPTLYRNFINSNLSQKFAYKFKFNLLVLCSKNNLNFGEPSNKGKGMSCLNCVYFVFKFKIYIVQLFVLSRSQFKLKKI